MWPQPPRSAGMTFESLAIDEAKIGGALVFRLAESVNAIIAHRRVRDAVIAAGIAGIVFMDPKDWAG
jgi:hypothetical protein